MGGHAGVQPSPLSSPSRCRTHLVGIPLAALLPACLALYVRGVGRRGRGEVSRALTPATRAAHPAAATERVDPPPQVLVHDP